MYIGDATHSAKSVQLSVSNNLRRNFDADEAIWRGLQHTFPARSQLLAPLAILSKIDMIARSNGNSMETNHWDQPLPPPADIGGISQSGIRNLKI